MTPYNFKSSDDDDLPLPPAEPETEYDRIRREIREDTCTAIMSTLQSILNHCVAMNELKPSVSERISMQIYHLCNKLNYYHNHYDDNEEQVKDYVLQLLKEMNDREKDYIRNWQRYQEFQNEQK